MNFVIIESPFHAADTSLTIAYARRCLRDSLFRGEAPFVPHLLYTQAHVLDDLDPAERNLGLFIGTSWYQIVDLCAVYTDLGISDGMRLGIAAAERHHVPIDYRALDLREDPPHDPL